MAFWGEWPRYVPVAERRAKARREMDKLRKKGKDIQPVNLDGRTIARSFWGKGWCDHLESFSDYANRLPRGRTYLRNGSVLDLIIAEGRVEAYVAGSELYRVTIGIAPLAKARWQRVVANRLTQTPRRMRQGLTKHMAARRPTVHDLTCDEPRRARRPAHRAGP